MIKIAHFSTGSQLYGLTNSRSDHDYLVVIQDGLKYPHPENTEIEVWDVSTFRSKLMLHDLKALEVYFSNTKLFNEVYGINFKLVRSQLRRAVSAVVSNAHVKAKKKIRDGEIYIGMKSYWHTIRILTMYLDLAKEGSFDPSGYKNKLGHVYDSIFVQTDIEDTSTLFNRLVEKHDPLARGLLHEFRLLCPLEGN